MPWIPVPDHVYTDIAHLIEQYAWGGTQPTLDDWQDAQNERDVSKALYIACGNGHVAILEWLMSTNGFNKSVLTRATLAALSNDHIHAVRRLYRKDEVSLEIADMEMELSKFYDVLKSGDVFQANLVFNPEVHNNDMHDYYYGKRASVAAFNYACQSGNMHMMSWVRQMMGNDVDIREAKVFAAKGGHISIIQHLTTDNDVDYKKPFLELCAYGWLTAAHWLLEKHPDCLPSLLTKAISLACRRGSVSTIRWLISKGAAFDDKNFADMCGSGNLEAVIWVVQTNPMPSWTATPGAINQGLSKACSKQKWHIARWLVVEGGADDLTPAVNNACKSDIPFAKWLVEQGGDATGMLIHACQTDMGMNIVKWCVSKHCSTARALFYTQDHQIRRFLEENGARDYQEEHFRVSNTSMFVEPTTRPSEPSRQLGSRLRSSAIADVFAPLPHRTTTLMQIHF